MENPSLVYRLGSWTSPAATGWARGGGGSRRGDGDRDGVRRHRRAPSLAAVSQRVDGVLVEGLVVLSVPVTVTVTADQGGRWPSWRSRMLPRCRAASDLHP